MKNETKTDVGVNFCVTLKILNEDFSKKKGKNIVIDKITGKVYNKTWYKICMHKLEIIQDFGHEISRKMLLELLNSSEIPFEFSEPEHMPQKAMIRIDNIARKYIYEGK